MSYIEKINNLEKITIEHLIDLRGIMAVIRDSSDIPKDVPFLLVYYTINGYKFILNNNKDLFKSILDSKKRYENDENNNEMFIKIKILIDGIESNEITVSFLNKIRNRLI